jgi:hypothetical protein
MTELGHNYSLCLANDVYEVANSRKMTELGHNYSLCLAKDVYEAANSRKMTEFGTPCALANDVNIDSNGTNIQLTLVFGVRLTLL